MDAEKIIAVDFDGTLCENRWPEIGEPNHEVIQYVESEQQKGAKLILWTCRAGDRLANAIRWCKEQHDLVFDAINRNIPEIAVAFGDDTRKVFANEYIDDRMCTKFTFPIERTKKNEDS